MKSFRFTRSLFSLTRLVGAFVYFARVMADYLLAFPVVRLRNERHCNKNERSYLLRRQQSNCMRNNIPTERKWGERNAKCGENLTGSTKQFIAVECSFQLRSQPITYWAEDRGVCRLQRRITGISVASAPRRARAHTSTRMPGQNYKKKHHQQQQQQRRKSSKTYTTTPANLFMWCRLCPSYALHIANSVFERKQNEGK